jgi:hypothetical protein
MDKVSAPSTHPYIPRIPPFQPRLRRSTTPIPTFNRRAAIFYGIRSRLPLPMSHAACARHHISRKTAASAPISALPIPHVANPHTATTHHIQTQLLSAQRLLTDITPVIQNLSCASSSCCIHGPANRSHIIPGVTSSPSTPLHDLLKPAPSPCTPSSIFGGFFGG